MQEAHEITLDGRVYENIVSIQKRIGVSPYVLRRYVRDGMKPPVTIVKTKFYDRVALERWMTGAG